MMWGIRWDPRHRGCSSRLTVPRLTVTHLSCHPTQMKPHLRAQKIGFSLVSYRGCSPGNAGRGEAQPQASSVPVLRRRGSGEGRWLSGMFLEGSAAAAPSESLAPGALPLPRLCPCAGSHAFLPGPGMRREPGNIAWGRHLGVGDPALCLPPFSASARAMLLARWSGCSCDAHVQAEPAARLQSVTAWCPRARGDAGLSTAPSQPSDPRLPLPCRRHYAVELLRQLRARGQHSALAGAASPL